MQQGEEEIIIVQTYSIYNTNESNRTMLKVYPTLNVVLTIQHELQIIRNRYL